MRTLFPYTTLFRSAVAELVLVGLCLLAVLAVVLTRWFQRSAGRRGGSVTPTGFTSGGYPHS
jgi:hypothetical protein